MKSVVFHLLADEDLATAMLWYEGQKPGLGREFLDEVARAVHRVKERPRAYPRVKPRVHRAKVARFPYLLYYEISADRISVLAALHGKRGPAVWRDRYKTTRDED